MGFMIPAIMALGTGGLSVALGPKEEPAWKRFLVGATVGGLGGLGMGAAGAGASAKAKLLAEGALATSPQVAALGTAKGLGSAYAATGVNPAIASLGGAIAANPGTSAMLGLGAASAALPGGQSGGGYSSSGPAWWEKNEDSNAYYV